MRVLVGKLSYQTQKGDLERAFPAYGTVESATVLMHRDSGRSKGFGFVEMADRAQARSAINCLNGEGFKRPCTHGERGPSLASPPKAAQHRESQESARVGACYPT